jgi:protein arginine N-methyltransferase 3
MAPDFASREAEASDSSESEASDVLDLKDDEGWEDAEPDEEEPEQIVSLLDNEVFPDVKSMLSHCKDAHQFDFLRLKSRYSLDFYGCIKLVNFIRSEVKNGRPLSSELSKEDFDKDDYLRPVMQDDALLFNLDEVLALTPDDGAASAASPALEDPGRLLARIAQLEEELHKTQTQFLDYKDTVAKTAGDAPAAQATEDKRDDDSHYFSSYSYNGEFEFMTLCDSANIQ